MANFLDPRRNLISQLSDFFHAEDIADSEGGNVPSDDEGRNDEDFNPAHNATTTAAEEKDIDETKCPLSYHQCVYLRYNDYIQTKLSDTLKEEGFTVTWNIESENTDRFIGLASNGLKQFSFAQSIIRDTIAEVDVKIGENIICMIPDIHIRDLNVKKEEVMVSLDIKREYIKFTGPRQVVEAVGQRLGSAADSVMSGLAGSDSVLSDFLADGESVSVSRSCFQYICKHRLEDISNVNGFGRQVYVTPKERCDSFSIDVEGPIDDIQRAVALIEEIASLTTTTHFRLETNADSVKSALDVVADVEDEYKCVVEFMPREMAEKLTKHEAYKKTNVSVQLAEIQHFKADVIVNTSNKQLDIKAGWGISAAIHKSGGPDIQKELRLKYPDGIAYNEIAISGPGKLLNCKAIYHCALPPYRAKDESSYQMLVMFMINCLQKANSVGHKSIAFPALGTGVLRYPAEYVARLMYQSVWRFLESTITVVLEEIYFVIYPSADIRIRQFFTMENLSSKRQTKRVGNVQSLYEEVQILQPDPITFEACLSMGKSFIQFICDDVKSVFDVSKCALIIWTEKSIEQKCNPSLNAIDPKIQETFNIQTVLGKSRCVVDKTTLVDCVLIHSVCVQDDDKNTADALARGFKMAKKEHIRMLTLPLVDDVSRLGSPDSAAPLIMETVKKINHPEMCVSIAVPNKKTFASVVVMAMDCNRRQLYVPPSVNGIVESVLKSTNTVLPGDSMLRVTSVSKYTNLDAATQFSTQCKMELVYNPVNSEDLSLFSN